MSAYVMRNHELPTRLYDCDDKVIRNSRDIKKDLAINSPPYLIVSHVWGDVEDRMLPGIPWECPITDGKFEIVLAYCARSNIRWLWMDCICIRQRNSGDAGHDKEAEIGKMNQYYRNAFETLCIPENYSHFTSAYEQLAPLRDFVADYTFTEVDMAMIWECIGAVDIIAGNSWFRRTWVYQEMLLSKAMHLPNGTCFDLHFLSQIVHWYYIILHKGFLQKPEGGTDYDHIHPGTEWPIKDSWVALTNSGWDKGLFERNGTVNLLSAIMTTSNTECKYPVDRLYGLYGLIGDSEKVHISYGEDSTDKGIEQGAYIFKQRWRETMEMIIQAGNMWPLLIDFTTFEVQEKGRKWMPVMFHSQGSNIRYEHDHLEILDSKNDPELIEMTDEGLKISVKQVGRVVGASAAIGAGGGDWNKIMASIWILGAMGFNIAPIQRQTEACSDIPYANEDPEVFNAILDAALHSHCLMGCFYLLEWGNMRTKSLPAFGTTFGHAGNVISVQVDEDKKPIVMLAWIFKPTQPIRGRCHVFDVTSDGAGARWVVANKEDNGTYTKIGTVKAHPLDMSQREFQKVVFN